MEPESPREALDALPLIGIRGDMGAGKDTLAEEICRLEPKYTTRKFAAALREVVRIITDIPAEETVSGDDKARDLSGRQYLASGLRQRIIDAIRHLNYQAKCGEPPVNVLRVSVQMVLILTGTDIYVPEELVTIPMTVGRLLQVLGTECFRKLVHSDIWVETLVQRWYSDSCPPTVIADTRFPNESAAIHTLGGVVILVRRGAGREDGRSAAHASERALDGEEPDLTIDNDGTIADLGLKLQAVWPLILDKTAENRRAVMQRWEQILTAAGAIGGQPDAPE